jgi:hypothetical protein
LKRQRNQQKNQKFEKNCDEISFAKENTRERRIKRDMLKMK